MAASPENQEQSDRENLIEKFAVTLSQSAVLDVMFQFMSVRDFYRLSRVDDKLKQAFRNHPSVWEKLRDEYMIVVHDFISDKEWWCEPDPDGAGGWEGGSYPSTEKVDFLFSLWYEDEKLLDLYGEQYQYWDLKPITDLGQFRELIVFLRDSE